MQWTLSLDILFIPSLAHAAASPVPVWGPWPAASAQTLSATAVTPACRPAGQHRHIQPSTKGRHVHSWHLWIRARVRCRQQRCVLVMCFWAPACCTAGLGDNAGPYQRPLLHHAVDDFDVLEIKTLRHVLQSRWVFLHCSNT